MAMLRIAVASAAQEKSGATWTVDDQLRIRRVASLLDDQFGPPFQYSPTSDLVAFVTMESHLSTDETAGNKEDASTPLSGLADYLVREHPGRHAATHWDL